MDKVNEDDLIDQFLKDIALRHFSPHSIESYRSSLHLFQTFLKKRHTSFSTITRNDLREYVHDLQQQSIGYKTIQNRFSTYNTFYDYLVYEGYLAHHPVREFRKHYLTKYKEDNGEQRKLVSVEEMARFIHLIPDARDRAIALLFAKTGIRRRELVVIDIDDINWQEMSIHLKPTNKRSNLIVYFDYETAVVLRKWLDKRTYHADPENKALFVTYNDKKARLNRNGVGTIFTKWAILAGLHDPTSEKLEEAFTPHCCRHWFTTHLRRAGMPREFIMELRGDKRTSAMDTYYHIDHEELRRAYLGCIPQLGII